MALTLELKKYPRLTLMAETAAELMTPSPVSIPEKANVREALALLTDRGIRAAPVIDAAGRPIGVLSSTDLLVHERETMDRLTVEPETLGRGIRAERGDNTLVRDLMTPAVFSVAPETPAAQVISEMTALRVHRVFVVDDTGVLVGVISALDVLRHLEGAEKE